ncbi:MAG: carbohydrate kinase family protein [Weeksellaceae bacterium]
MTGLSAHNSIIVTGSIAYDDIMNFPGFFKDFFHPEKLHQINVSFAVQTLNKHLGGTATNIAYNLTRITDKNTRILGAMGQDHAELTSFYKKNNISYEGSIIDSELYTSTGKVITDNANNQIWGFYYGAAEKGNQIDLSLITEKDFVIISANHLNAYLHIQDHCVKKHISYLYDPGMSLTWISDDDLRYGIEEAKYVIGNDYEIAQIERRLKLKVADLTAKNIAVITTLGADGVRFEDKEKTITVSGFKVDKLKDPTGAGDAWRGGFVGALVEGNPLAASLRIANALASFAVENFGTVRHTPSRDEIMARAETLLVT